jgi:hypothetical protein
MRLLGGVLNFIANIPAMIGSSLFAGAGASIAGAMGFTEAALSIATNMINGAIGWGVLAGTRTTAGAIANHLDKKKKKETPEQRRKRLIESAVNSALWRLRKMTGCKELVKADSSHDPIASLEALKSDRIVYDPTLRIPEQVRGADLGQGPNSKIHLGDTWFEEGVGGWKGTMNAPRTRTNILLHGLKHAVEGRDHAPGEANNHYYNEIAKKCFGINP